jgi:H+/gluconate symporter-like permease
VLLAVVYAQSRGQGDASAGNEPTTGQATDGANGANGDNAASSDASDAARPGDDAKSSENSSASSQGPLVWPLIILGIGIAVVLGLIIVLKVNAFIALISAAIVVSLLADGGWAEKISRVATAFGSSVASIGIVIAMAAVIGKCMLDSGAADRIVRAFLHLLGVKRAPLALMGSGFVLSVPVFFDTVFYLLVPLARSMHRRTGKQYMLCIMAIVAGGAITHTLVPPTPGPLVMADNLNFDVGWMIMVGGLVAIPTACVGMIASFVVDRLMKTPMRQIGATPDPEPLDDAQLPRLWVSLLPVVLPVLLISTNTVLTTIADSRHAALLRNGDVLDWPALHAQMRQQAANDQPSPGRRIVEFAWSFNNRPIDAESRRAYLAELEAGSSQSEASERDRLLARMQEARSRDALISLIEQQEPLTDEQQARFVAGLNDHVLASKGFHRGGEETAFLGIMLNDTARDLLSKDRLAMKKSDAERMNRALLESAYPSLIEPHRWNTPWRGAADISAIFGNANLALLISTVIAMLTLVRQRKLSRVELAHVAEVSLMSGGVIILITAGGGAFGKMLVEAKVGEAIQNLFQINPDAGGAGMLFLVLGFAIGSLLKIAQGSSTVAMITGTAMLSSIAAPEVLGFHPVYLATAIGGGSLIGSWMNDSGFWIFAKMGGLTEAETLKSWSVLLIVLGTTSFLITLALAKIMPLV